MNNNRFGYVAEVQELLSSQLEFNSLHQPRTQGWRLRYKLQT